MKKIFTVILGVLILSTPLTFAGNDSNDEKRETAAQVSKAVENETFRVSVISIIPQGAPMITSSGEYSITVRDGVANGRLPFFGRSYTSVFGSEDPSVVLEDTPVTIRKKSKGAGKQTVYEVRFKTDSNARWEGIISIYDNGKADINCTSSSKSPMTYFAELDLDYKPSEE